MFDFFLAAKHMVKTFLQNEQKLLHVCREQRLERSPHQQLGWAGQPAECSPLRGSLCDASVRVLMAPCSHMISYPGSLVHKRLHDI